MTTLHKGKASWYGEKFAGRKTANGDIFDPILLTAASNILPLGSKALVVNEKNNQSVLVKINDRGGFKAPRIIDLSHAAAKEIGIVKRGVAGVTVYGCKR